MLGLWGITLETFKARLEADKDGELSASFMDVVTAFLRDSNISVETVEEAKDAVEDLASAQLIKDIADATKGAPLPETPPATPARTAEVIPLHRPFDPPTT